MNQSGMTLVELVVVLVILTALSTVVITSSAGLTDATRFERTRRGLEELRTAVAGPDRVDAGSTTEPATFLADIGRLPRVAESDGLGELWRRLDDVPIYGPRRPLGDLDLVLMSGWRGPYLRRGVGESLVKNGWGRYYVLRDAQNQPAAVDTPIGRVVDLGSDNAVGGELFAQDLEVVFVDDAMSVSRHLGDLAIHLSIDATPTTCSLAVRVYGIRDGQPVTLAQQVFSTEAPDGPTRITASQGERWLTAMVVPGLPVGPKWIRSYLWRALPLPTTSANLPAGQDLGTNAVTAPTGVRPPDERSVPQRIVLPPVGGESSSVVEVTGTTAGGGN